MDRQAIINLIEQGYRSRTAGELSALEGMFAPGATFTFAGQPGSMAGMANGPTPAMEAVRDIIEAFEMHRVTLKDSVVENDRAAMLWEVEVSGRSGERASTHLYDLWTFEDGKIKSIFQFADTALLSRLLDG